MIIKIDLLSVRLLLVHAEFCFYCVTNFSDVQWYWGVRFMALGSVLTDSAHSHFHALTCRVGIVRFFVIMTVVKLELN